jgi:hypothetical protein
MTRRDRVQPWTAKAHGTMWSSRRMFLSVTAIILSRGHPCERGTPPRKKKRSDTSTTRTPHQRTRTHARELGAFSLWRYTFSCVTVTDFHLKAPRLLFCSGTQNSFSSDRQVHAENASQSALDPASWNREHTNYSAHQIYSGASLWIGVILETKEHKGGLWRL